MKLIRTNFEDFEDFKQYILNIDYHFLCDFILISEMTINEESFILKSNEGNKAIYISEENDSNEIIIENIEYNKEINVFIKKN